MLACLFRAQSDGLIGLIPAVPSARSFWKGFRRGGSGMSNGATSYVSRINFSFYVTFMRDASQKKNTRNHEPAKPKEELPFSNK